MNATLRFRSDDFCWGDSLDVEELKRLLTMVDDLPEEDAEQFLRPRNLRKLLQLRPGDPAPVSTHPTIRAVLWDNDGVLVDSESAFFELTRRVFRDHHLELEPAYWAKCFLGWGMRTSEIAQSLGLPKDEAIRTATHRDILWRQRLKDPVHLNTGVGSMLNELSRKFRMAVVTGAPREHFEDIHRFTGLLRHFETTITADDCAKVKPEPDAYLMAANRLGLSPSECIAVEDSPRGMRAALAAGMRCAILRTDLTDMEQCADATWVLDSIEELHAILEVTEAKAIA